MNKINLNKNCYQLDSCQVSFPIDQLPAECSLDKGKTDPNFVSGFAICEGINSKIKLNTQNSSY